MGRATTKPDLIRVANEQFEKLWKLIEAMTMEEQTGVFSFPENVGKEAHWERDKNLRDVLIHLYEWHQLLLNWVKANQSGERRPFLPAPYNWKSYAQMNTEFWERHQHTRYEDSKKMLLDSHKKVMDMIQAFSNEELFGKNEFVWTGGSTLGAYCVSATASHYDWAMKKIKVYMKTIRANKG